MIPKKKKRRKGLISKFGSNLDAFVKKYFNDYGIKRLSRQQAVYLQKFSDVDTIRAAIIKKYDAESLARIERTIPEGQATNKESSKTLALTKYKSNLIQA